MKKIIICQRGAPNVKTIDDSDEEHDEYCKKLSAIFNMTNVVMLKLSNSTFMVRPSQLVSLTVEDLDTKIEKKIAPKIAPKNEVVKKSPPVEQQVDIITDVD